MDIRLLYLYIIINTHGQMCCQQVSPDAADGAGPAACAPQRRRLTVKRGSKLTGLIITGL